MKMHVVLDLEKRTRKFSKRLGHEPCLQTDGGIADFALDFGSGNQCRDGVDDDAVNCPRSDEHIADFKRLLSEVGLGDEHVIDIHAQTGCIDRVERMFRVDERHDTAERLRLGKDLQRQSGFAAGLRSVHLDDSTPRNAADPQRCIKWQCAGGYSADVQVMAAITVFHDGAFAELRFDLVGCDLEHLGFFFVHALVTLPFALLCNAIDYTNAMFRWSSTKSRTSVRLVNPSHSAGRLHDPMARNTEQRSTSRT